MNSFADLALLPTLRETLVEKNLTIPTDIQAQTVPALLAGRSVVGVAETGSGKTLAYALPILHRLKTLELQGKPVTVYGEPRAIVVVPTRELGEQVAKAFKPFTHTTRLRVRSLLGGTTMEQAKRSLQGPFEVLVATPGRLIKMMEAGLVTLGDVRTLVLDEADQMLDHGFLPDVRRIVKDCPPERQLAMFSATVPPAVEKLIADLFASAEVIRSLGSHRVVASLTTTQETVVGGKRFPLLERLLDKKVEGGTILFTNTREQCDKLAGELEEAGWPCVVYRGEMDKMERRRNLKAFREGDVALLISTDLASRGLDVEHVGRVINYHMPQQMENYLHRVGRTARAGRPGLVVNFVTERDAPLVSKLDVVQQPPKVSRGTSSASSASKSSQSRR
ncbi:MAG: DEAD/DEAH box helicase [Verrucomicrobia bacterium]|nr:DEAD/DEAH box helicase [Verrucomicrobiota bacterium]